MNTNSLCVISSSTFFFSHYFTVFVTERGNYLPTCGMVLLHLFFLQKGRIQASLPILFLCYVDLNRLKSSVDDVLVDSTKDKKKSLSKLVNSPNSGFLGPSI